jgi:hypothetical protein
MPPKNGPIRLELSLEEALELFSMCLSSVDPDTPDGANALRKLGQAIETAVDPVRRAS